MSTCLRHSPTNVSSSLYRCIWTPGPSGRMSCRCLGQREGPPVCVPAIQDGPSSSAEDGSVTRCQGDSDHSTATGSFMVSGVDGSGTGRSSPAVHRGSKSVDSRRFDRRRGDRDSSLPAVKSTRVETLRAVLRAKDHSREAAHMMSRSLRDSSIQVYESHWARFVAFCRSKRWHVFRVRSHHFSTYMMHLFRAGLLPAMIISHRTSVASVLRHWVYDPHIGFMIHTSSYSSELSCWNVRCSAEFCPSGTFILCFHLYRNRRSHQSAMFKGNSLMSSFPYSPVSSRPKPTHQEWYCVKGSEGDLAQPVF